MKKTIQVIERAFDILERLKPQDEVSLEALTVATRINKGTLCNILKTLMELGYVEKSGHGNYRLSSKFLKFGETSSVEVSITEISETYAKKLAEETMESGVVCTLRGGKVHILAQAQFQRALMINPFSVYKYLSLYRSVSGRALVSFLSTEERAGLAGKAGLPGPEWGNADTLEKFETECAGIRDAGICIMTNIDMEIKAFARPVRDRNGKIYASLGLTVPICRLSDDAEKKLLASLMENSTKMEKAFIKEKFPREAFIKI